jgi:hypothetical protein
MDVGEARAEMNEALGRGEGMHCPVCDQYAKVYRYKLQAGMAKGLILMYREHGRSFGHQFRTTGINGGTVPKLAHWGLLEAGEELGYWRVTAAGESFVRGGSSVPRHIFMYNQRCLGLDDEDLVDIRECLGDAFSYDELMGQRF